jgi:hypothetical protein
MTTHNATGNATSARRMLGGDHGELYSGTGKPTATMAQSHPPVTQTLRSVEPALMNLPDVCHKPVPNPTGKNVCRCGQEAGRWIAREAAPLQARGLPDVSPPTQSFLFDRGK